LAPDGRRKLVLHQPNGLEICRSIEPALELALGSLTLLFALHENGAKLKSATSPASTEHELPTGSLDRWLLDGGTFTLHHDSRGRTVFELSTGKAKPSRIYHGASIIDVLARAKHLPRLHA